MSSVFPTNERSRDRALRNGLVPLLAALSLGLAPFTPEPHLVGKLRWVAGGAQGMAPMDWMGPA